MMRAMKPVEFVTRYLKLMQILKRFRKSTQWSVELSQAQFCQRALFYRPQNCLDALCFLLYIQAKSHFQIKTVHIVPLAFNSNKYCGMADCYA